MRANQEEESPWHGRPGQSWSIAPCLACKKVNNSLYILALATLRPYRRRGLATALLRWAEDRARAVACTQVSLHARASDAEVIAFYLSRGFQQTERVPDYYPFPGDANAVVLTKTL
jgi:ribosomal protein S18 acetylase RimI-like enzyme